MDDPLMIIDQWLLIDMTNQVEPTMMEGIDFYGPFDTFDEAREAGQRFSLFFHVVPLEHKEVVK